MGRQRNRRKKNTPAGELIGSSRGAKKVKKKKRNPWHMSCSFSSFWASPAGGVFFLRGGVMWSGAFSKGYYRVSVYLVLFVILYYIHN